MPILSSQSLDGSDVRRFVSSDDLQRLKQMARRIKRTRGVPHHEALDVVARRIQMANWHQVVEAHDAMLPTEQAVREGIVIAMDVKEAPGSAIVVPQGRFVTDPLLEAIYKRTFYEIELNGIDEEDGRPNREKWTDEQLREFAQDALNDVVLYRFVGENPPFKAAAIVDLVAQECFFGPAMVWIKGKMYDAYSLPGDADRGYVRF